MGQCVTTNVGNHGRVIPEKEADESTEPCTKRERPYTSPHLETMDHRGVPFDVLTTIRDKVNVFSSADRYEYNGKTGLFHSHFFRPSRYRKQLCLVSVAFCSFSIHTPQH